MKRDRVVVVGGGIGGMVAALLLADSGFAVELVEAGPRLGAGWRSLETPFGTADLGIRVPRESGNARADALVFHADPALCWHDLGAWPREGHIALGRWNPDTACPDARAMASLSAARAEMIERAETPDPGSDAPSLAARWTAVFGPILLDALLRQACRATLGAEPEVLAPDAAGSRIPSRVVLFDAADTDRLRGVGFLAARLAHPRAADAPGGMESRRYLYPRKGGIGRWTAALEASLHRAGIRIRTGMRLAALRRIGARIVAAQSECGAELPLDLLVLAAPPRAIPGTPPLQDAALPVGARLLVFEDGAPPMLDWAASYDPDAPFLRIGFPDRLEGREPGRRWRAVVEARLTGEGALPAFPPRSAAGRADLACLRILGGARPLADIPLGTGRFAVETLAIAAARAAALDALAGYSNLGVLRSAAGGHALAGDLIADAARLVARVTSSSLAA